MVARSYKVKQGNNVLTVSIETVSYTHLDVYKRQTWKACPQVGMSAII